MSYPTQREKLVAEVLLRIEADVKGDDYYIEHRKRTALYKLLSFIQSPTLYKYLEEGDM